MTYRGYKIEPLGTFAMYQIKQQGSGKVPNELAGEFTTVSFAKTAIDNSLAKLVKGRKSNAKKESSTTG